MMRTACACSAGLVVLVVIGLGPASAAPHIRFPDDAGHVDVTKPPYSADPTGVADSTDALQRAIDDLTGKGAEAFATRRILYLPNGTYRLTASLRFNNDRDAHSSEGGGSCILGETHDGVVLRLDDSLPQYADPGNPQPIISTINPGKWGNVAFMLSVMNLTLDAGRGNPGASGIRFIASNQGSLKDVVIRSSDPQGVGHAGIDMATASIPGPALIKNVRIEGFDYGIRIASPHYHTTIEHAEIIAPRVAGIHVTQHSISIRGLRTRGDAPALVSEDTDSFVVLIDADLHADAAVSPAIQSRGHLVLRDIRTRGYPSALKHGEQMANDADIDHWTSTPTVRLDDSAAAVDPLPVEETPAVTWDDPSTWVSPLPFLDNPGSQLADDDWNDDSQAIQAAIDSMGDGQHTLYFPPGNYKIDQTIILRGNVRRVCGLWSKVGSKPEIEQAGQPLFLIPEGTTHPVVFDMFNYPPQPRRRANAFLENRSPHDVILQHVYVGHGPAYVNRGATGRLFLEDVCALAHHYYAKHSGDRELLALPQANPQFDFGDQQVWARQFNPEQFGTMLHSDGGKLWILGMKTEMPGTAIHAVGGAHVELLGGTFMPVEHDDRQMPAFVIRDSTVALAIAEYVGMHRVNGRQEPRGAYRTLVEATRNQSRTVLLAERAPRRLGGRAFALPRFESVP